MGERHDCGILAAEFPMTHTGEHIECRRPENHTGEHVGQNKRGEFWSWERFWNCGCVEEYCDCITFGPITQAEAEALLQEPPMDEPRLFATGTNPATPPEMEREVASGERKFGEPRPKAAPAGLCSLCQGSGEVESGEGWISACPECAEDKGRPDSAKALLPSEEAAALSPEERERRMLSAVEARKGIARPMWSPGRADIAELGSEGESGELERLRAEVEEAYRALGPTCRFMDPPDGGSPSLGDQVRNMREELEAAEQALAAARTQADALARALVEAKTELEVLGAVTVPKRIANALASHRPGSAKERE